MFKKRYAIRFKAGRINYYNRYKSKHDMEDVIDRLREIDFDERVLVVDLRANKN